MSSDIARLEEAAGCQVTNEVFELGKLSDTWRQANLKMFTTGASKYKTFEKLRFLRSAWRSASAGATIEDTLTIRRRHFEVTMKLSAS